MRLWVISKRAQDTDQCPSGHLWLLQAYAWLPSAYWLPAVISLICCFWLHRAHDAVLGVVGADGVLRSGNIQPLLSNFLDSNPAGLVAKTLEKIDEMVAALAVVIYFN